MTETTVKRLSKANAQCVRCGTATKGDCYRYSIGGRTVIACSDECAEKAQVLRSKAQMWFAARGHAV